MIKQDRQDLVINGSGSSSGGVFHYVKINGDGQISGNIDCMEFKVNGSNRVNGNVKANLIKVNGISTIEGTVDADELTINGQADIGGDMSVRQLKLHGKSDIGGNLTGDNVDIGGELTVHMDCEAEKFVSKGSFAINGLLNAGNIEVHLYGPCKVREIGGEIINVKKAGFAWGLQKIIHTLFPNLENRLFADMIEGDDIYLEYTTAKTVRGGRVSIGPGCEIGSIEYRDHFELDKGALVNEHHQF
jgi:cytoskeletal protein CcmA (bactofilin family)